MMTYVRRDANGLAPAGPRAFLDEANLTTSRFADRRDAVHAALQQTPIGVPPDPESTSRYRDWDALTSPPPAATASGRPCSRACPALQQTQDL